MKSEVNVKVRGSEYVSRIEFAGDTLIVQTEDMGIKSGKIVTRTYQKGAIVSTQTTDYDGLAAGTGLKEKIKGLMDNQHLAALNSFSQANQVPQKTKAELAIQMNAYLRKGNRKAALEAAKEALLIFPDDPFFLSHSGYLVATVERRPKEGYSSCEKAIKIIAKSASDDKDYFYPIFYLNLGEAYLAGRQKKAALDAFYSGLKYDAKHKELLARVRRLGLRRPPVIRFLDRGNPLNKYLGKIRHRLLSGQEG
jgi:tetratricopeptide (TPR) repeat protein